MELIKLHSNSSEWTEIFKHDNIFNTIPLRWELILSSQNIKDDTGIGKTIIHRIKVNNEVKMPNSDTSLKKTVLVDAKSEITISSVSTNDIKWLIKACESKPCYNFLLWASHPEILQLWQSHGIIDNWPSNVSLAFRINTLEDAKKLNSDLVNRFPFDTIWFTPIEPIILFSTPDNIKRVIIGEINWLENKSVDIIISLRKTIGNLLTNTNNIIIDIEKETQKIFYQL